MPTEPLPFAYDPVQQLLVLMSLAGPDGRVPCVELRTLQAFGPGSHADYCAALPPPPGAHAPPPAIQVAPDMGSARAMARSLRGMRRH